MADPAPTETAQNAPAPATPTPLAARAQLLDTASQLMREGDTVDVSLSELASASGLNSALVKYYFGNKAGLLTALLERDFVGILSAVDALLAKDADPETKLRLHMSAVVRTFFTTPYIHRLLMRLIRESAPEEGQRLADAYLRPLLDAYHKLIGEGVRSGVFREVDPLFFYFTVVGAADRFYTARYVLRYCAGTDVLDEALSEGYRAHLNDFVVAGILVPR
jgi:TetR/AcrR family transcriptional regulator